MSTTTRPLFRACALALVFVSLAASRDAAAQTVGAGTATATAPAPASLLIHAGTLIDGTGAAAKKGVDVLVKDGRIEAVGDAVKAPPGTTELDLRRYTVTRGPADAAIQAVGAARVTLQAGFTTVRDCGAAKFVDVALQRAIDAGDALSAR